MTHDAATDAPDLARVPTAVADMPIGELLKVYASRSRGEIGGGSRPAIIVIDFSVAFTVGVDGFSAGRYDAEVAQTQLLLRAARGRFPVLFTTISYTPGMSDAGLWGRKLPSIAALREGSPGVAIDARLEVRVEEPVMVKKYPSAFFGTDLDQRLAGAAVDTLIITGCTTSVCVRATAVDAMQLGYRPLIAAEAVGDFHPALHAVHLTDLGARYADVVPVDQLISYLASLPAGVGRTG